MDQPPAPPGDFTPLPDACERISELPYRDPNQLAPNHPCLFTNDDRAKQLQAHLPAIKDKLVHRFPKRDVQRLYTFIRVPIEYKKHTGKNIGTMGFENVHCTVYEFCALLRLRLAPTCVWGEGWRVGSARATCRRRSSTCCSACRRRTAAATG